MRAMQGVKVSSTMTKSNPRPRKYASASDRQAAYRARAPEMCLRAESKTVDTLDKIADDLDISRADLLLSMTKFALANHDWARFGLTHKPLPFKYGIEKENIAMNPLPIWARPRPKNLGKSIPLTAAQKRKAKSLAAAANRKYPNLVDNIAASRNPTMKKPSPAQIAARKKFAEMARSGALNRKRQIVSKANPAKKTVSQKISQLVHEGYPQKQSIAIALSEQRKGKVKSNPMPQVAEIILQQLGGNKFIAMTGAKRISGDSTHLSFKIPKNESKANAVAIYYDRGSDTYTMKFFKQKGSPTFEMVLIEQFDNVYADMLRPLFTDATGLETSLGTMGRKTNPMQGALLRLHGNFYGQVKQYGNGLYTATVLQKVKTGIGEEMDYYESKEFKTKAGAARYLANHGKTMSNPASGRKGSRTLLNPMAAPVKSKSQSNFKYCVETNRILGGSGSVFETVAMFPTKAQAQDYAKAILKSHPDVTLRIKTYK